MSRRLHLRSKHHHLLSTWPTCSSNARMRPALPRRRIWYATYLSAAAKVMAVQVVNSHTCATCLQATPRQQATSSDAVTPRQRKEIELMCKLEQAEAVLRKVGLLVGACLQTYSRALNCSCAASGDVRLAVVMRPLMFGFTYHACFQIAHACFDDTTN